MIAVESGASTSFPPPDLDASAILTPCLETQVGQFLLIFHDNFAIVAMMQFQLQYLPMYQWHLASD